MGVFFRPYKRAKISKSVLLQMIFSLQSCWKWVEQPISNSIKSFAMGWGGGCLLYSPMDMTVVKAYLRESALGEHDQETSFATGTITDDDEFAPDFSHSVEKKGG